MASTSAELVLDAKPFLGEGPHWDAVANHLWWVDIIGSALHAFDPATGSDLVYPVGDHVGTVVPRASGGVILALARGIAEFRPGIDAAPTLLVTPTGHPMGNRFNDGTCDPAGRLWAGTIAYDESAGAAALYRFDRLDAGQVPKRVLGGVTISNGLAWDLERKLFHFIDTPTKMILSFAYDHDSGTISSPRAAVRVGDDDGYPDGMAIDAEGMLWVAHWGGHQVVRWDPSTGKALHRIRLPVTNPTACAFGGPKLDRLYITSARKDLTPEVLANEPAGGLFVADPGVTGFAAVPFAS